MQIDPLQRFLDDVGLWGVFALLFEGAFSDGGHSIGVLLQLPYAPRRSYGKR